MKVLVACEYSGRVRDAFRRGGHDAWSCDLLQTDADPRWHIQGDVRALLGAGWDLMVAHPPCTYLAVSGARWWAGRRQEQRDAIQFVRDLLGAPIPRIAVENPVGALSSVIGAPTQIIHPWQFGHGECKATCLWLLNLDPLQPTAIVPGREQRIHRMPPSEDRWKKRSETYQGIADAMAEQWGRPQRQLGLFCHA